MSDIKHDFGCRLSAYDVNVKRTCEPYFELDCVIFVSSRNLTKLLYKQVNKILQKSTLHFITYLLLVRESSKLLQIYYAWENHANYCRTIMDERIKQIKAYCYITNYLCRKHGNNRRDLLARFQSFIWYML